MKIKGLALFQTTCIPQTTPPLHDLTAHRGSRILVNSFWSDGSDGSGEVLTLSVENAIACPNYGQVLCWGRGDT